ncbi:hypothetical protein F4808DRAFT_417782 [Astrocystis sublimbata]|nr:hypothetical protein F4808DRAFT_417782 [Astrocystis sublimbata]
MRALLVGYLGFSFLLIGDVPGLVCSKSSSSPPPSLCIIRILILAASRSLIPYSAEANKATRLDDEKPFNETVMV